MPNTPYRGADARPRIVVPGVLSVVSEAPLDAACRRYSLRVGALAGYFDGEDDLSDWKGARTYVPREDLTPDVVQATGVSPLEALLSKEHPRLHRLFARAPIVQIDGAAVVRLRQAGARVVTVGFTRNADDFFHFSIERGGVTMRLVSGALLSIEDACSGLTREERAGLSRQHLTELRRQTDSHRLLDRVLRAASDGLVDENAIALAGYFHFHKRDLDEEEKRLAEIEERAEAFAAEARTIAGSIAAAGDSPDALDVPVYGSIQRTRHAALTLRDHTRADDPDNEFLAHVEIHRNDGELERTLALPARDEWRVEDVEPWVAPTELLQRERWSREVQRHREGAKQNSMQSRRHGRRRAVPRGVLQLLALLILLLVALLLRRR